MLSQSISWAAVALGAADKESAAIIERIIRGLLNISGSFILFLHL
jgi:hypothetical protein